MSEYDPAGEFFKPMKEKTSSAAWRESHTGAAKEDIAEFWRSVEESDDEASKQQSQQQPKEAEK